MVVQEFERLFFLWCTPFFVILIIGEIIITNWLAVSSHKKTEGYSLKDTLVNAYLMLSNIGIDLMMRSISLFCLFLLFQYKVLNWGNNTLFYWILLFLLEDLIFYWIHRTEHMIRIFWAIHVTHHSSENFNLTTGFRSSVFQPIYRFIWFLPLTLLGFHPFDIFIIFSVTQTYGILLHTVHIGKLGILESILVTPSHHRVHHASNIEYLDKNMGMCLIIWDKLFNTFQEEKEDIKPKFGLYQKTINTKPIEVVFHEFQSIYTDLKKPVDFRIKIKYLIKPPGWSHDGSSKTSEELRSNIISNE